MFDVFINAWKVKDIRRRILYILLILAIYRVGCHIYLPGMDVNAFDTWVKGNTQEASLFSIITGGKSGTVFAMGIAPYINASIIMQLLTVAVPYLENIQKEGESGRKKIQEITRFAAIGLALMQGIGTVYSLHNFAVGTSTPERWLSYITMTVAIVTGTMFIMWISELLTAKAIGNGASFIIFANILASLPAGVQTMWGYAQGDFWSVVKVIVVLLVFVAIIAFTVFIQDGERRIPVQYSKKMVGRQMFGGQSSYIPIKVNIAGVMSIIFAISLLQLPQTVYQFVKIEWLSNVVNFLNIHNPTGALLYVILIFCFTFFYTSFAINPIEMAENMKKNGGFIPGIRPGKPTSDYVQRTVFRLSWIGAAVYSIMAMLPVVIGWVFNINVGFGGTTLLIVVGVALELDKQLESQLLMRHYKGFLS